MDYAIFSVDDTRKHYIDNLEAGLKDWNKVKTPCVDGRIPGKLHYESVWHPYRINQEAGLRVGHLGIWYTVLNALEYAPLVTFEDDALLGQNFGINFKIRTDELPEDFDFFSLFIPRDSDHLYTQDKSAGVWITKTYQRYGGVSMYYSEQGAAKIKQLLKEDGINDQYDNTLYRYAREGKLNGYCSKPDFTDLVYITGQETSIVQETNTYAIN